MRPCVVSPVGSKRFFHHLLTRETERMADPPLSRSTPVGLQYEKFIIPDAIRILDSLVETLAF